MSHSLTITTMKCPLPLLVLLHLVIATSTSAYEIWSVYFDDSKLDVNDHQFYRREQFFDLPFATTRHVFEITTYVNNVSSESIVRMELSRCEPSPAGGSEDDHHHHLPYGATRFDRQSNRTWTCLERIVSQRSPLLRSNETILRFPPDVGLALGGGGGGEEGDEHRLLLLIEYNRDYRQLDDNSGFDLYLSDESPPLEAGIMAMGVAPDARFFIPPNTTHWSSRGTCYTSCFASAMHRRPLQVVGLVPSTEHHLLKELTVDVSGSGGGGGGNRKIFAWGGARSVDMSEEASIEPGDEVNVRCVYNTNANATVPAGLAPGHENCLVWMHYYPKLKTDDHGACLSGLSTATLMSMLDLSELSLTYNPSHSSQTSLLDEGEHLVTTEVRRRDRQRSWSRDKLMRSKFSRTNGRQRAQCGWHRGADEPLNLAAAADSNQDNGKRPQQQQDNGPALIDVRLARRRRHRRVHRLLLTPGSLLWR